MTIALFTTVGQESAEASCGRMSLGWPVNEESEAGQAGKLGLHINSYNAQLQGVSGWNRNSLHQVNELQVDSP